MLPEEAMLAQVQGLLHGQTPEERRRLFAAARTLADRWDGRVDAGYSENLGRRSLATELLQLLPEELKPHTHLVSNLLAEVFYPPEDEGLRLLDRVRRTTRLLREALKTVDV